MHSLGLGEECSGAPLAAGEVKKQRTKEVSYRLQCKPSSLSRDALHGVCSYKIFGPEEFLCSGIISALYQQARALNNGVGGGGAGQAALPSLCSTPGRFDAFQRG